MGVILTVMGIILSREHTCAFTSNRQIARAAGTVMLAFVLSNMVGLVRQMLVTTPLAPACRWMPLTPP